MRFATAMCVVVLLAGAAAAEEKIKSGLAEGDRIGAFFVVKCAGAEDDGVKIGQNLCYRCKYGGRPMAMVFYRGGADKNVTTLIKGLDKLVADNADGQVKAFVNILAEDTDAAEEVATKLGKGSKNVPVVVPVEVENGPQNYGLNPKAHVTVILASGSKVVGNHALGKDGLNDKAVEAILADATKKLGK